jgi:hypothetical protein
MEQHMTEDQSPSNELGHQILEALTISADVVCDLNCTSVWKTGEKQPHSDECKKVRAARSAWMDFLSYGDLIASGGLPADESPALSSHPPQSVLSSQNVGQCLSEKGQLLSKNHERSGDEGRTGEQPATALSSQTQEHK